MGAIVTEDDTMPVATWGGSRASQWMSIHLNSTPSVPPGRASWFTLPASCAGELHVV